MKSKPKKRKEAIARMRQNILDWEEFSAGKPVLDHDRQRSMNDAFVRSGGSLTESQFAKKKIKTLELTIKNTEAK